MTKKPDTQTDDIGRDLTPALGPEQVLHPDVLEKAAAFWLKFFRGGFESQDVSKGVVLTSQHCAQLAQILSAQAAQLAEAQAGGWISVQERLPEHDAMVMFYAPEGYRKGIFIGYHDYSGWWYAVGESTPFAASEPTHWQKLPAPPAQEASDGE